MENAGTILTSKYQQQFEARQRILESTRPSSIETNVVNTNNISIETAARLHKHQVADECQECLPPEIDALIDNKNYRRKYRSMIKNGFLKQLLALVEYTRSMEANGKLRESASHFFTIHAGKAMWQATLKTLAKLAKVQKTAEIVAAKIGSEVTNFIYRQIWKGINVERWADQVREMGHDKPGQSKIKHFAWLCQREASNA